MALLSTTYDLITKVLRDCANIPDPTSGNQARLRERTLEQVKEGLADLWLDPDGLTWTRTDSTVTISGTSGPLPANFREVGADGSVWSASGDQLAHVPAWRMQQIQQQALANVGLVCYSIFGQTTDTSGSPATMNQLLQVPPGFSGQVVTLRAYKKQVPTLTDSQSDSGGLEEVPGDVVLAYLHPYLRFRVYDDRNDRRAARWEARYEAGRKQIKANDRQGKDTPQVFVGYHPYEGDEYDYDE